MKRYIWVLSLLVVSIQMQAQNYVCKGDTAFIVKPEVRGDFYWQGSDNGVDWSRISSESGDTLMLSQDQSAWYRLEVIEGNCQVLYSSLFKLDIVEMPVVSIPDLEDVCENEPAFILEGAFPAVGEFKGSGIIDGKFIPEMAGPGESIYYYLYSDSLDICSDSIFGSIMVLSLPDNAKAGVDQEGILEDSVYLTGNVPTEGAGEWKIIEGVGGTIVNPNDPNSAFLKGDTIEIFVLEWTIRNSCGSSSDQIKLEFVETSVNPCPGTPFVFDKDGNRYKTVQIGNQCWMGENLKYGQLITSTEKARAHSNAADNSIVEVYGWKNDPDSLAFYGGLYDWNEMMDYSKEAGSQGICPEGWHVPTRQEWFELDEYFVNNDTGFELQVGGGSGFDAVLSGSRNATGAFYSLGSSNLYWSSSTYTYDGADEGYYFQMLSCNEYLRRGWLNKNTGASIRCVKNE